MTKSNQVLFVSSYPPRACGIATYSRDLINAVHNKFSSSLTLKVCALENDSTEESYPDEVKLTLKTSDFMNYIKLAYAINEDPEVKKIFVQHEFGLFGGQYGEYLLYMLYFLRKPVSTTFHTVLPDPDEKRKKIVQSIAGISEEIVVMTKRSAQILQEQYGLPENKIVVIYHGTHNIQWKDKKSLKKNYQLEDRLVMSTFGLLSSNKSIETALDALPGIVKKFPNALYFVLGRTHPGVVAKEGEKYRHFLESRVEELNLENNVRFIDKYFELTELLEYLTLSDVYLFTSKDPHQAVSGTFAYAMSCACPIVSTPIPHAKEMLNDNAGILFDFGDSTALAEATMRLLDDTELREEMGLNAFHHTRVSLWENAAISHARLFSKYISSEKKLLYDVPEINLTHIHSLTDHKGIIQFAKINEPDFTSGYTLDDNARALIALLLHYEKSKNPDDLILIEKYLDFVSYCQQPGGDFLNYVDKDGLFHSQNKYNNLQDSNGRAIWAIGFVIKHGDILPARLIAKANLIMERAIPLIPELDAPRAEAFALKGLFFYSKRNEKSEVIDLIGLLADRLVQKFLHTSDETWRWFEYFLTYANSVLPEALLYAHLATKKIVYKEVAKTSFEFLLSHIFPGDQIRVISNRGWHHKTEVPEQYGEQPIDVAYTIFTLELFSKVFSESYYLEKMEFAFSWFLGKNHLGQTIYNPLTGGCHDGLEKYNINLNQGAESTVCYLIARLIIERNRKENRSQKTILPVKERIIPVNRKRELVYSTRWSRSSKYPDKKMSKGVGQI